MLKTAGHVRKHYKPMCRIFEGFKDRGDHEATLTEFIKTVEIEARVYQNEDERMSFKGDMLEVLAEIFFKAFENNPAIGLREYVNVPLEEDYGVDGHGVNPAGKHCAVQAKYRSNPLDLVTYAEIARTFTSGKIQLGLDLEGDNCVYVFTTALGVNIQCQTVFKTMLRVLNREVISREIDKRGILCGLITEDDLEHLILIRGTILAYSAEVSHLADWSLLAAFMKKKFGAKEVLIASEEDGSTNIVNHLILEFETKELAKKYRKLRRQVASIKGDLQTLHNSCIEGQTGDWDCSTDEGREGFIAMAEGVEKIAKTLNLVSIHAPMKSATK